MVFCGNGEETKCPNDYLVEVKVNEYVKKSELTVLDIRALVVRCSSCGCQINHLMNKAAMKHRKLGVLTCRDCYEFYGSSEFSQDESGYNYCTWCGNGGKLIVCDFCPNGFCSACIRRNFGRSEISVTMKEGWKCYCCDKTRLEPKARFCDLILDFDRLSSKKEKKAPPAAEKRKTLNEKWLEEAFDGCDNASKMFHKKLGKLKRIGITKSKSLKHVVKKLEDVINNHKSELKNIIKQVTEQYSVYIESQRKAEEERIAKEHNLQNAASNEDVAKKEVDCIIIGDDTPLKNKEPPAEVNETIQAKLSLLKSSSDSDSQGEASKPDLLTESHENGNADVEEPKARRALNFELSDSNSENESDKKQKVNISEICDSLFEENEDSENKSVSVEDDPKLKLQTSVDIFRCDTVFKIEDGSVLLSDGDDEEKLDKLIDSLCKSPIKRTRRQRNRGSAGPKCKKVSQPVEDSSSSISLSSDDERGKLEILDQKKSDLKKSSLDIKVNLITSGSNDSSLDSEMEEEEKEKKKSKSKTCRKKESDSSDDFVPRKKKKYDKLLHGPLLSDNEKKPKVGKEKKLSKKRVLSSEEEKKLNMKKGSSTTDSESEEELRNKSKNKKKRKRIKKISESSDDENQDKENADGQTGKGRKNIKKIISQKKLSTTTKEAQLEEKERKRRIEERQKLYNQVVDTSVDGKQVITKKLVLEEDKETNCTVEIHPDLVCKLKPHQVNGVKFMWECTIETVKDLDKPGSGCILAHCMGLGKTLQVITFLHTCLTNPVVGKTIKRAMVICPYNTALNWASEFDFWLHDVEGDVKVHQLAVAKSNLERHDILRYWFEEGGVLITSYDIFRRLGTGKVPKLKARERKTLTDCLLDPGPDIVVCDEGHVLKNETSAVSKATSQLRTRRRIVLTGTPLQNNLKEYHCMLSFVKPNLLGTAKEFRNRFVNPIMNGQYDDSNEYDVKLMKKRIHILHKLLDGCVQRCDYSALTKFLPPRHEFVISIKLSEVQMKMYECYLERIALHKKDRSTAGSTLFIDFNNLRCIWNHPYMCIESHRKHEYKRMMADDDDDSELADFICDDSESSKSASTPASSSSEDLDEVVKEYKTRSRPNKDGSDLEEQVEELPEEKQWYHEFISDEDRCNFLLSGKMVLLLDILRECEAIGDKIIVFSQSLLALNAIEEILHHSESLPISDKDKDRDVVGRWIKGLDYFRMDGSTNLGFRKNFIDMFNNPLNDRARLFLISTKAGGLGTNLVGANRVIVFDTSWNPSHDVQAIFRVYRFGQTKPVYIYRFLAQGTMEEKIYDRQVTKLSLSCRVVDEQQIDRHFSAADLAELYTFDRNSTSNRPTPLVPKDRLLAEMLIKNKDWIVTYHEHDSLLQSQTEEDLTEEERQAAWTEYENEREPPPSEFGDNMDFAREPDFASLDYEGKIIPDIQAIIIRIFDHLKSQMPGVVNTLEFKKKLLVSVYKVRQVFQEKHVKILRMKQECVARGTVPNAVNKYMDEVSRALKDTGDYINRLKITIAQEEAKLKQQANLKWQENLKKMQEAGIRTNIDQEEWKRQLYNLMSAQSQAAFRARMPQTVPPSFVNSGFSFQNQRAAFNHQTYSRPKAKPVITEADENAAETMSVSTKQPTIIEVEEEPASHSKVTPPTTVTIEEID